MTPKRLWLITLLIFLIYVGLLALLLINGIRITSKVLDLGLEVFLSAIVSVMAGTVFALIGATIPWNKKGYKYRFNLVFPVATSLFILIFTLVMGGGYYMKSEGLGPLKAYDTVKIPSNLDCSSAHEGDFETDYWTVKREGDLDFYTVKETGDTSTCLIKWISDCECENFPLIDPTVITRFKIIRIDSSGYTAAVRHKLGYVDFLEVRRMKN